MLKTLKNVSGSASLTKKMQKAINGGFNIFICSPNRNGQSCVDEDSGNEGICWNGVCYTS